MIWQVPLSQVGVALVRAHAVPQNSQSSSVLSGSQPLAALLSQLAVPSSHLTLLHMPPWHICEPVHFLPHSPQLAVSSSLVSQPLLLSESQSPKPVSQFKTVHLPALHEALAFSTSQALSHAPQVSGFDKSASQPLSPVF